jgi:hypothetical protein
MNTYISADLNYICNNCTDKIDTLLRDLGINIPEMGNPEKGILTFWNHQTQWSFSIFNNTEKSKTELFLSIKQYQEELAPIIIPLMASISHIIGSTISSQFSVSCSINLEGIKDRMGFVDVTYLPTKELLVEKCGEQGEQTDTLGEIFLEAKGIHIPTLLSEEQVSQHLHFLQTCSNNYYYHYHSEGRILLATLHIPNLNKSLTKDKILALLKQSGLVWTDSSQHPYTQGFFVGVTYELWEDMNSDFVILFSRFETENFLEDIETIAIHLAHLFADALLMARWPEIPDQNYFANSHTSIVREIRTGKETVYRANQVNPLFSDSSKAWFAPFAKANIS